MKIIYFVRHGETDFNKKGIIQGGGVDSSLNEMGKKQATHFYNYYNEVPFDIVFTSTLKRTNETAQHFLEQGLLNEQKAELNEMNWGVHEGKAYHPDMRASYVEMIQSWANGDLDARLEKGESAFELIQRTRSFIDYLKELPLKNILVFTHGRTLRCLMTILKDEPASAMEKYKHSNTGLFLVTYEKDKFKVILENDTRHLDGKI